VDRKKQERKIMALQNYRVETTELAECRHLVETYHYAKGGSNTATFRHGLIDPEDYIMGCAWWIPPTKSAALANYPEDWRAVLVLHRLVCHPEAPRNSASFLIARSIKLIKKDLRWAYLLTYADTWQGHTGAIYKATNWDYLGVTKPESHFIDADGRSVSRKAGPKTRTRNEMAQLGYKKIGPFVRHRYGLKI
jgi:hypothetical protein